MEPTVNDASDEPSDAATAGDPDKILFQHQGALELNGAVHSDVINLDHDKKFEVENGTFGLTFNADTTSGFRGLVSKDAEGNGGTGDHLSAFIKRGTLEVLFESETDVFRFKQSGIEANRDYDLEFGFGSNGISVSVDGVVVASDGDFQFDFLDNSENLQIGALGRNSEAGHDMTHGLFDGTISDVTFTMDGIA